MKGILEWVVLGLQVEFQGMLGVFWDGFRGGMVGKWWGGIVGFLGELGGSTGRAIGAWKGAGLLEKKEEVLLNSEERIGERIAGGRP